MKNLLLFLTFSLCVLNLFAQNSLVGDGFGGRLWYKPYNYTVGSYSAYTICGSERQLYGWGSNNYGQLGEDSIGWGSDRPIPVPTMDSVALYSTGYVMGAIKRDGSGYIWGKSNLEPVKVIDDVFFVDAGIQLCAFVKNDGTVWSVGEQYNGEFGNGIQRSAWSNQPVKMDNITNAVRTASSYNTTCILLKDSTVFSVGSGPNLGAGASVNQTLVPVQVKNLKRIVDIKSRTNGSIALDDTGAVWTWGRNVTANNFDVYEPVKVEGVKDIVAISACNDGYHFMALDKNKNCYSWGPNYFWLATGRTDTEPEQTPTIVANNVADIMAGETFSYLVKIDGSLYSSGYSSYGGSIWLDLENISRASFTKINPAIIGLCEPSDVDNVSYLNGIYSSGIPSEAVIYFPNAFTPNGDNNNDLFRAMIRDGAIVDKYKFEIYNRWGQRVFYTEDIYEGWGGRLGGIDQPWGTYFFHVTFNTPNRKPLYIKGDVTLVR